MEGFRDTALVGTERQRGFSMMELLVAVLVMGIGVLAVTGMQMIALQNNQDALLRSEALTLAYDIMDRIRVNPPDTAYDGVDFADAPAAPQDCIANSCSAANMVTWDLALWKCSLGGYNDEQVCTDLRDDGVLPAVTNQPGLPNGQGQIQIAGGVITVTLQWNGFNNVLQTITVDSQG